MKVVNIAFGNITQWSKKLLSYLAEAKDNHLFLAAETHVQESGLSKAKLDCKLRGWRADFSPAARTCQKGSSGGTAVLCRSYLAGQPLCESISPKGDDWVGFGLHLRGGYRILLVCLYLTDDNTATAISSRNMAKLHAVLQFCRRVGTPTIVAADWNMEPKQLAEISWLDDMRCDVVRATDLDITCTTGRGRLLDFFAVSRSLVPTIVDVHRDPQARWSPHAGLILRIRSRPKQVVVRSLVVPSALDLEKPADPWKPAWDEAVETTARWGAQDHEKYKKGHDELDLVFDTWALEATTMYSAWARAAEKVAGANFPCRGQFPRLVMGQTSPAKTMESWTAHEGESFWQKTSRLLLEIELLGSRDRGPQHILRNIGSLQEQVARFGDYSREPDPDTADRWFWYLDQAKEAVLQQIRGSPSVGVKTGRTGVEGSTGSRPPPSPPMAQAPASALASRWTPFSAGGGPGFPWLCTTSLMAASSQVAQASGTSGSSSAGGGPGFPWLCTTSQVGASPPRPWPTASCSPSSGGGGPLNPQGEAEQASGQPLDFAQRQAVLGETCREVCLEIQKAGRPSCRGDNSKSEPHVDRAEGAVDIEESQRSFNSGFDLAVRESTLLERRRLETKFEYEDQLRVKLLALDPECTLDICTPEDGHCLFHALRTGGLSSLSVLELRRLFITLPTEEEFQLAAASTGDGCTVSEYKQSLATSGYGDNLVLAKFALHFGKSIAVITAATARTFAAGGGEHQHVDPDAVWVGHRPELHYYGIRRFRTRLRPEDLEAGLAGQSADLSATGEHSPQQDERSPSPHFPWSQPESGLSGSGFPLTEELERQICLEAGSPKFLDEAAGEAHFPWSADVSAGKPYGGHFRLGGGQTDPGLSGGGRTVVGERPLNAQLTPPSPTGLRPATTTCLRSREHDSPASTDDLNDPSNRHHHDTTATGDNLQHGASAPASEEAAGTGAVTAMGLLIRRRLPLDILSIRSLRQEAELMLAAARKEARSSARKGFHEWAIAAVQKGAGKAHTWCKKAATGEGCLAQEAYDELGEWVASPLGMMSLREKFWADLWTKNQSECRKNLPGMLGHLKQLAAAQVEELGAISEDKVLAAVQRLAGKKKTRWSDGWTAGELLHVLRGGEALQSFTALLRKVEEVTALPAQAALAIVSLMAKPGAPPGIQTGERPICLFSVIYQVWGIIRGQCNQAWEDSKAAFWDTAIRGSSALYTALSRALLDEAADINGIAYGAVYFDMEKFYDHVRLDLLLKEAIGQQYPPLLLLLSLQAFTGRRLLRADGCTSQFLQPSNSLGAGCRRANTFARIVLYEMLEQAHLRHFRVRTYQYVDDLVARTEGSQQSVCDSLTGAAITIFEGAAARGLKVSLAKTRVGGPKEIVGIVLQNLKLAGFPVQTSAEVKDLGIGQGCRRRRQTGTQTKRLKLGLLRLARIRQLKFTKRAKHLMNSGLMPSATYGGAAGWTTRNISSLRLALKSVLQGGKLSSCVTSTIHIHAKDPWEDPGIKLPCQTLVHWHQVWSRLPVLRQPAIRRAWDQAAKKLGRLPPNQRWKQVAGPITATIAVLLDIGWLPLQPDSWVDTAGSTWDLIVGFSSSDLKYEVNGDLARLLWKRASLQHAAKGLEEGPDLTVWKAKYSQLLGSKKYDEAGMQAVIATGGYWTQSRRHKAGLLCLPCWRCGAPPAECDELHTFWTCPHHLRSEVPAIKQSAHHVRTAVGNRHPCFWLRGLVPSSLTTRSRETSDVGFLHFVGGEAEAVTKSLELPVRAAGTISELFQLAASKGKLGTPLLQAATDGSGGPQSIDRRTRVCGWGYVTAVEVGEIMLAFGAGGGLAEAPQTVQHSELTALKQLLQHVVVLASNLGQFNLQVYSDATYVVCNFNKGRAHCEAFVSHAGCWRSIFDQVQCLSERGTAVTVTKCAAHSTEASSAAFLNTVADGIAGAAADKAILQFVGFPEEVRKIDETAKSVLDRLVYIGMEDTKYYREPMRLQALSSKAQGPPQPQPRPDESRFLGQSLGHAEASGPFCGLSCLSPVCPEPPAPQLQEPVQLEGHTQQVPGHVASVQGPPDSSSQAMAIDLQGDLSLSASMDQVPGPPSPLLSASDLVDSRCPASTGVHGECPFVVDFSPAGQSVAPRADSVPQPMAVDQASASAAGSLPEGSGAHPPEPTGLTDVEPPAPCPAVPQAPLTHPRGYSQFESRSEWAAASAIDRLRIAGHTIPSECVSEAACTACLLVFPRTTICAQSKEGVECEGPLFVLKEAPLAGYQTRSGEQQGTALQLRGKVIHHSHQLRHFSGLVWCGSCGSVATVYSTKTFVLRNLAVPCDRTAATTSVFAKALNSLKLPAVLKDWPGPPNLALRGFV